MRPAHNHGGVAHRLEFIFLPPQDRLLNKYLPER
jgi:hypothetical protein